MANTFDLPSEGCETRLIAPDVPCATHNASVLAIDNYIYRVAQEMTKNQSSRVTSFSSDDIERINSYYAKLSDVIDATGDTISDFHWLVQFALAPLLTTIPPVENDAVNTVLTYLLGADMNLRVSQSTRLNDGLLPQDKKDLVDAIAKSKALFDTLASTHNPHDMPQSSPSQPVVEPTGS